MVKRRVVALKFSCGLQAGELKNARQMLDEAGGLSAVAEAHDLVFALRGINVTEGEVEVVVALNGHGTLAEGVKKVIELVDDVLTPRQVDGSVLSLRSVKLRKA